MSFYVPLESTCYLFIAYCHEFFNKDHAMDLLYLLKENFKNLLFDLLIIGRSSRICLIYQVDCYHKDEDSEEYAQTYYEALNQTLLRQYIIWPGSLWFTQQEVAQGRREKGGRRAPVPPPLPIFWSKHFFPHEIGKHKIFTCE